MMLGGKYDDSASRRRMSSDRDRPPTSSHDRTGGFFPAPLGKHTRFDNEEGHPTTGRKRERTCSRERRDPGRSSLYEREVSRRQGSYRGSAEPSKRAKYEHPSDTADPEFHDLTSSHKLQTSFLSADGPHSSRSTPVVAPSLEPSKRFGVKLERRTSGIFDLGREAFSASVTAIKHLVSGSGSPEPPAPVTSLAQQLQDALEAAAQAHEELKFAHQQLSDNRKQCKELRQQVAALQADERHSPLDAAVQRQKADVQETRELVDRLVAEAEIYRRRSVHNDRANASLLEQNQELAENVKKYEGRIQGLISDKGKLNAQLKKLRSSPGSHFQAASASTISLDPFDNKVDQVSEAAVKNGAESLNDSIDTFVCNLLDAVDEPVTPHPKSSYDTTALNHGDNKLLTALVEHRGVQDKRGFLLDAFLHNELVHLLDSLFFSGEVVSRTVDKGTLTALFTDMSKREPWTVVQRWRALAAASGGNLLFKSKLWKTTISARAQSIITVFAWVYHQPAETFEPLVTKIQTQLEDLCREANQLALSACRDVLSVRMSVVVAPEAKGTFLPFNPNRVVSVWPDMGAVMGDEVIALYKFGLKRQTEDGQNTLLVKPQVTTVALLREMAKV
ncbi:hypothetical protein B0H15DRAFT_909561 [Mycena belliarum]|uniref:Uncharacterized protein n=1 Tax=Mycena belliarum TaxID=1033014 RepID=A0AAD6XQ82_9AGAR|nr:hypothetical protein B0H15DRAFT_909561 [Mycena belliae]